MSIEVVPNVPADSVDPPEVVREKAGVDRTTTLIAGCIKKVRAFNKRMRTTKQELARLQPKSLFQEVKAERDNLSADRTRQVARFRPVIVAAEELARYTSGLIENARLPQIDKIELQLRNAELEAELIEARHLMG